MRTHHFSFHPSPFLLDGVTSKPFDGVHSFGKSPKHFPFNQKNYWIGTLPQNRPHTCGVIIHKAAATMAASVATKLYLMKPCGKLLELGWFGLQEFLYISLITWWHFSVSFIFVIWVFPLHFTSVNKITELSVIFLWNNGVLICNCKENKEAGAICFEIRIPRKKNKELL